MFSILFFGGLAVGVLIAIILIVVNETGDRPARRAFKDAERLKRVFVEEQAKREGR